MTSRLAAWRRGWQDCQVGDENMSLATLLLLHQIHQARAALLHSDGLLAVALIKFCKCRTPASFLGHQCFTLIGPEAESHRAYLRLGHGGGLVNSGNHRVKNHHTFDLPAVLLGSRKRREQGEEKRGGRGPVCKDYQQASGAR